MIIYIFYMGLKTICFHRALSYTLLVYRLHERTGGNTTGQSISRREGGKIGEAGDQGWVNQN